MILDPHDAPDPESAEPECCDACGYLACRCDDTDGDLDDHHRNFVEPK